MRSDSPEPESELRLKDMRIADLQRQLDARDRALENYRKRSIRADRDLQRLSGLIEKLGGGSDAPQPGSHRGEVMETFRAWQKKRGDAGLSSAAEPSLPPLPTFLIIGAQKSATRWLVDNLGAHPEVLMADGEPSFFNNGQRFESGLEWYRKKFRHYSGELAIGESTPGYMIWRSQTDMIPARIDEILPSVRLIASLRDPVDRTFSAFFHHIGQERIPPDANFLEWLRNMDPKEDVHRLITGGWYAESLAPFIERFGDRLRVILYDDVVGEPEETYTRVLEHVSVSTDFLPPELQKPRHLTGTPEGSQYADKGGGRRKLTAEERAEVHEYFREDIDRLEALIGRDLSAWRP